MSTQMRKHISEGWSYHEGPFSWTCHILTPNGLVFNTYKPNNEKAKAGIFYRGAIAWNALNANYRNMDFASFKTYQRQQLMSCYLDQ